MRGLFFFAGFMYVKTRGRKASRAEAPILVVAPHSSYFDAFAVTYCGGASVFAKEASRHIPFFGRKLFFGIEIPSYIC
jgi:1-acyl-sn-glycerol-3-phosphate acyltransferase